MTYVQYVRMIPFRQLPTKNKLAKGSSPYRMFIVWASYDGVILIERDYRETSTNIG